MGFGQDPGALANAEHVENEGHAAIAHDRCAGVDAESFQLLAQGFHHDFLSVVDTVHHQPELPVFRLKDDHTDRFSRPGRFQPEHLVQIGNRQQTAAPAVYRCAVDMLDALFRGIALKPDQFQQTDLGDTKRSPPLVITNRE
jgi:hypothetical protein